MELSEDSYNLNCGILKNSFHQLNEFLFVIFHCSVLNRNRCIYNQVMIGAGSGLAPFRGFWQHLMVNSLCSDGSRVVEKVSFYEAVKIKTGCDNGHNLEEEIPSLLARKARLMLCDSLIE